MTNYLLYDGGCLMCTGIADQVQKISDGWLTVRSLDDPEMAALVAEHDPNKRSRPRLVMEQDGGVQVLAGPSMSLAIVRGIGLRRAIRVSGAMHEAIQSGDPSGRRSFLRTVGVGTAVATGFAMGGSPASAANGAPRDASGVLSQSALTRLRIEARRNKEYLAAVRTATLRGYDPALSESVGIDMGTGDVLMFTFIGHGSRPEREAAVITFERVGRTESVALETVAGDPEEVAASRQLNQVLRINSLAIAGVGPATYGKKEYFSCVAFCVGANCASKAIKCRSLIFMYAVLACMVIACGSKVKTCHKVCKKEW